MEDKDLFTSSLSEYNRLHNNTISSFKPLQEETLKCVVEGDTLAILPTGYGKSLIYEVLPILHSKYKKSKTAFVIVIVPLNVIVEQQVKKLGDTSLNLTNTVLRDLKPHSTEGVKLLNGHNTYMFAHPETIIDQKCVNDILLHKHYQEDVDTFIVIDEAHCVLQWGENFRPSFQKVRKLRAILPNATLLAMSATLSLKGQKDLVQLLSMKNEKIVSTYPAKDNITLIVTRRPPTSSGEEESALMSVEYCLEPLILQLNEVGQDFPLTIVYFSGSQNWVGVCYELCRTLLGPKFYVDPHSKETARVAMYHASLEKGTDKLKSSIMKNLSQDPTVSPLKLVLSTVALGMGADLTHVKRVIQIGPPKTMEAYVQQAGRAGRSGDQAVSVMYYNNSDVGRPELAQEMKDLCRSNDQCRRKIVNSSFGFSDYPSVEAEICCDICNPQLKDKYVYQASRLVKCALRNTFLEYIAKDDTETLQDTLQISTIEQIVCQPKKYENKVTLQSEFNLSDSVSIALSTIISSVLLLHIDEFE